MRVRTPRGGMDSGFVPYTGALAGKQAVNPRVRVRRVERCLPDAGSPQTPRCLPRSPRGWYFVASRQAVLKAKLIQKTWMGENIVVWCDENGRAFVAEAVCPHLGSDLGPTAGGRICGGRLVCPFHGFEFDADVLKPPPLDDLSFIDGADRVVGHQARLIRPIRTPRDGAARPDLASARYRRHSAMFHSSLSQPLMRTPCSVLRWAETEPRTTSGIS